MADPSDGGGASSHLASIEAELFVLRSENARLRGLLGLDDRSPQQPTSAWKPTLFASVESQAPLGAQGGAQLARGGEGDAVQVAVRRA